MLRSLMTAVTGVRAHQTMLDVTGNNIANANTIGYKKDLTVFADLIYQSQKAATAPSDGRGGINPAQVGLGVNTAAIETIFTQGAASYTGNQSDMMINGNGFFIYSDGSGSNLYSRAGAMTRDANNNLVQSGSGYKLQGYEMTRDPLNDSNFIRDSALSDIVIPLGKKLEPKATTEVKFQCNLDSRSDAFLPYGFADLPYNAWCGWDGNPSGTARVTMNGTTYDMKFQTKVTETRLHTTTTTSTNGDATSVDGIENYFEITLTNGGEDKVIGFDMIGVDSGNPVLTLNQSSATGGADFVISRNGTVSQNNINDNVINNNASDTAYAGSPADLVYQFPGSTPPAYFTAQYDNSTGELKVREVKFYDATTGAEITNAANVPNSTARIGETLFTYNVKGNMNYQSFSLKGAATTTQGATTSAPIPLEYTVIAEFNERVDTGDMPPSEEGRTSSTLTMWYAETDATQNPPATAMHKMEAIVYFKADGTFDFADWVAGTDFPAGYNDDNPIAVGDNLIISCEGGTLMLQQASNLDNPGNSWENVMQINQGAYHQTKETIFDCDGNAHTLEVNFKKVTENRWRWEAFLLDGDGNLSNVVPEPHTGEIEFCGCGPICNVVDTNNTRVGYSMNPSANPAIDIELPFSINGVANSTLTLNFGGDGDALYGVTQFASETTTKAVYQNGYRMGVMENYSVGQDGTITGIYTNGQNIPLYRVALATFTNEQGLDKVGGTMFRATVNSGNANIDPAGLNAKGTISSQNVEMSNVDLTEEFTHLIIAQRGFQANTRVITTSDQILEEVVNLKR